MAGLGGDINFTRLFIDNKLTGNLVPNRVLGTVAQCSEPSLTAASTAFLKASSICCISPGHHVGGLQSPLELEARAARTDVRRAITCSPQLKNQIVVWRFDKTGVRTKPVANSTVWSSLFNDFCDRARG